MRKFERNIPEGSSVNSEIDGIPQPFGRLRSVVKNIVSSIISPRRIPEELYTALQNADVAGKMEIVEQLVDGRQGDLVMMGTLELRQGVAAHLMEKYKKCRIDYEKHILITCGAMEATMSALLSIVDHGDEVVLFSPYYPPHVQQVLLAGGKPIFVHLDEAKNWSVDYDLLNQAINKKTKAIIICNPSNPTGSIFSKVNMDGIIKIAHERNLFVINDETYNFLVYDSEKFCSPLHFPDKIQDRLISCFSFSKEFAITGMRVGYMLAPERIIEKAAKIHDALTICAPTLSQKIALLMLSHRGNWSKDYLDQFKKKRKIILDKLDKDFFSYSTPEGAYYFFVRYNKNIPSQEMALRLLHETKVITIPGKGFGEHWDRHLRLSFAGEEDELTAAIDTLNQWMLKN